MAVGFGYNLFDCLDMRSLVILAVVAAVMVTVTGLDNGAALLPPLLVSTQALGCGVNEAIVKDQIDQLELTGLAKMGFKTVLIYDCWQVNSHLIEESRDPQSGRII
jgi:hypothetical protein